MQPAIAAISHRERALSAPRALMIHSMFLICLVSFCLAALLGSETGRFLYSSSLTFVLLTSWMIVSWYFATGSYLNPYTLFIIAAALFNGGDVFLEILGLNRSGILNGKFDNESMVQTILFCALGLACFHTGALIAAVTRARHVAPLENETERNAVRLGYILLAIGVVPALLLFRANISDVLSFGYMGLYRREARTSIGAWEFILSQCILPGVFLLAAGGAKASRTRWFSLFVISTYVLLNYFLGYRGFATAALAAYAWVWHTRVRRLPAFPMLAVSCLLLFAVFPMIRFYRSDIGEERLQWGSLTRSLQRIDNPAIYSISEMGGSMKTVAYTMQLVPSITPYEHGASYAFALLTLIPNIFGTPVHPTIAHGIPSTWLIQTIDPMTANASGGWGYSFLAEAYLNFGWAGVCLIVLPLGWAFASLQFWAERKNSATASGAMAVVLFFMLIYARAETANIVRGIVWYGILPYLISRTVVSKDRKVNAQQNGQSGEEQSVQFTR